MKLLGASVPSTLFWSYVTKYYAIILILFTYKLDGCFMQKS